jgi:hypothetical protein
MGNKRAFPQAIGLAIVVLLLVGCGAGQPAPTPTPVPPTATPLPTTAPTPRGPGPVTEAKDIVGTCTAGGWYLRYDEDGTFRSAGSREALENEQHGNVGEFWFSNGQYHERIIARYGLESEGIVGIYEVQLLENGKLLFSLVEDERVYLADITKGERIPVD